MMITEDITRDVAEAQVSDDCRVELWVADLADEDVATLTASQARSLAAELVRAAGEAERAADELLHVHAPAGFDLVDVPVVHEIRQETPWPPHPEADYMLSRFSCTCGWDGLPFKDTKAATEQRDYAASQATEHLAGVA